MLIKSDLDMCKSTLQKYIGKRVRLTSNGGRKRLIVYEGVVECCYPNVFTVRCTRGAAKDDIVSYSYVDVLTRTVRITTPAEKADEVAS